MKKFTAVMLSALMAVTALTGCSGGSGNSNSDTKTNTSQTSSADWDYIKNKGELVIGITYFEPMNYKDDSGKLTGFETEFAESVCKELGVKPVFQKIDWDSKEVELKSKTIDCIWNGLTITDERKANMDISVPYMENKQVMVTKKENAEKFTKAENLKDATVVAEKKSAGEDVAKEYEFFKDASYVSVDSQAKALLEVKSGTADIAVIDYVPFDSDTIGNPALDVGDILSFTGGQADATKYACITSNSIKIGGRQSIKCVGKNPKLSQAKSKNDKNISGLLAQIEAGKIGIHTFTNASAFTVRDVDTKIISIEFATTEANHAQFFGQVIVDVTAQPVTRSVTASGDVVIPSVPVDDLPVDPDDPEEEPVVIGNTEEQTITVSLPMSWQEDGHADVIFSFEFNNQMIPVHYPQENWHSGRHTILLYYPIENVVPNYTNIFNVYMRCVGGTAAVDTGMCIASISGQSMGASAAWDGRIDIEEYVDLFRIGNGSQTDRLQVKAFTESDVWEIKETVKRFYSDVKSGRTSVGGFAMPVDVPGSNT